MFSACATSLVLIASCGIWTRRSRALVIGGGFIGIEVAENLHERGPFMTLAEGADQIIAPFDPEMAAIVHAHMREKHIELYLSA